MPIDYQKVKSPGGYEVLRTLSRDMVNDDDAAQFNTRRASGGEYHRYPLLALTAPDVQFTPNARKTFSNLPGNELPQAIVVTSTPVRVLITFMMKLSKSAQIGDVRLFGSEAEGMAWIDELMGKRAKAG